MLDGKITVYGGEYYYIRIDNISVGGMKFMSTVDIPIGTVIECRFNILDSSFRIFAAIVHKYTMVSDVEYRVKFDIDRRTTTELFQQLNKYLIVQRRKKS
ncbi:MAG: PilZ domain-containing protein [Bacillus sp. (in: Bacteria)]|nr:PilZ domain-containing protein [Bacillus sp. (in: firmicutes)]